MRAVMAALRSSGWGARGDVPAAVGAGGGGDDLAVCRGGHRGCGDFEGHGVASSLLRGGATGVNPGSQHQSVLLRRGSTVPDGSRGLLLVFSQVSGSLRDLPGRPRTVPE